MKSYTQMKKWFSSKEYKKTTVIILILSITLFTLIIGFLHFNMKLYDMSLEHSTQQVEELSTYVEKNLQLELERYIHLLEVTGLEMENNDTMFPNAVIKKLNQVHYSSTFNMMGVSDLNGRGVDSEGNHYNISYEHLREHIENDEVFISNVLKNQHETLIFIAVPLKINDKIVGILWGKCSLEDLVNHIEMTNDSYKYFQIIDDRGNYLLSYNDEFSVDSEAAVTDQTIWQKLKAYTYKDGMSAEKIYDTVQKGESGSFYCEANGKGRYVGYRPLNINNWYLFSVQVEDGLHSYVHSTRKIAFHFFTVLTIALLTIFGVIYHLTYTMYKEIAKQHHEIQTINVMFKATLQKTKNIPFIINHKLKQIVFYGYPTKDSTQAYSFDDMQPENMIENGLLDAGSLEEYQELYKSLISEQKPCDPVIIYSQLGDSKEWIRVSIISDTTGDEKQIIGVLEDYSEYKKKDLQIQDHLVKIERIKEKAETDFLTKLYNREAFLEKISNSLTAHNITNNLGALLLIDLDNFKDVNDTLGHGMGDIVLQETANILHNFFGHEDIIGRLGGDEFVVFVQSVQDIQIFKQRIKELNNMLCNIYKKNENRVHVSVSIGIALTNENNLSFDKLYEQADQALYKVKQAGRNGYKIYYDEE